MISKPDLLIIDGGPGGYADTIRATQLGLSTVCVEKEKLLSGVCLREGCIHSKFLLNFSHIFPYIGISFNESPKANE
jgi:dihydrolipoamide dehydrogenase